MHYLKLFVIFKILSSILHWIFLELLYKLEFGRRRKEMKIKVIGY